MDSLMVAWAVSSLTGGAALIACAWILWGIYGLMRDKEVRREDR